MFGGPLCGLRCREVNQDRQNQTKYSMYNKLLNKINVQTQYGVSWTYSIILLVTTSNLTKHQLYPRIQPRAVPYAPVQVCGESLVGFGCRSCLHLQPCQSLRQHLQVSNFNDDYTSSRHEKPRIPSFSICQTKTPRLSEGVQCFASRQQ
jgi:hypothetical protein